MNDTVALVLDPEFGDRIRRIRETARAVWAVSSAVNRRFEALATMLVVRGATAEEWFLNHLDTVDQHHNAYSEEPPYSVLDVYGCQLTSEVERHLPLFDFKKFESRPYGFRAWKH